MNTIRALLIILGCLAAGETAVFLAGIKLPGSIVGMGVLFALCRRVGSKRLGCNSLPTR